MPALDERAAGGPVGQIEIAVVGAHLSGMPLNHELTGLGGSFVRSSTTTAAYRLFALPGGPPFKPGLVRVTLEGQPIIVEVWSLPAEGFGRFVAGIPSPLGIGTLALADGTSVKGFLCEAIATEGALDISGPRRLAGLHRLKSGIAKQVHSAMKLTCAATIRQPCANLDPGLALATDLAGDALAPEQRVCRRPSSSRSW